MSRSISDSVGIDQPETSKLKVFISYSRKDLNFANQLEAALSATGFATSLDLHSIEGGGEWRPRLAELIRDNDTVVFVLSPSSAVSEICTWEVDEAARLRKRIFPVVCRPLEGATPQNALQDLHYIYFYEAPEVTGSGFGAGLAHLIPALNTDTGWIQEHTRLLGRAMEWDNSGRSPNRLLFGTVIAEAKEWSKNRPKGAPDLTELHLDFIRASEVAEAERADETRRENEKMKTALDERESALQLAKDLQFKRNRLRVIAFVSMSVVTAIALCKWREAWLNQQALDDWLTSTTELRATVLNKPCDESILATQTLASTTDPSVWQSASTQFWRLYRGPMIILENYQRKKSDGQSIIATSMVDFGRALPSEGSPPPSALPMASLSAPAAKIKAECDNFLNPAESPPDETRGLGPR